MLLRGGQSPRSNGAENAEAPSAQVNIQHAASRVSARAGALQSLSSAAGGAFFGLCAALLAALFQGLLPANLPSFAAPAAIFAIGACVGAAAGALRRTDRKTLLIRADRLMDSRDLMSTAYGLLGSHRRTIFEQAILEDAARLMSNLDLRRAVPVPRLTMLKLIPLPALAVVFLLLFPVDLPNFPSAALRGEANPEALTSKLDRIVQELEQQAAQQEDPRELNLAREVRQLVEDLESGMIGQSEALQRLSDLQEQSGVPLRPREADLTESPTETEGAPVGASESEVRGMGLERGEGGGMQREENPPEKDPSEEDDPLKPFYLASLQDISDTIRMGSGATTGRQAEEGIDFEGPGQMAGGGGEGPEQGLSTLPGTRPVDDEKGSPTKLYRGAADPTEVEGSQAGGEELKTIVRALPDWFASQIGEEEVLRSYSKQAESALVREDIPQELRKYVKSYFLFISMIKRED